MLTGCHHCNAKVKQRKFGMPPGVPPESDAVVTVLVQRQKFCKDAEDVEMAGPADLDEIDDAE